MRQPANYSHAKRNPRADCQTNTLVQIMAAPDSRSSRTRGARTKVMQVLLQSHIMWRLHMMEVVVRRQPHAIGVHCGPPMAHKVSDAALAAQPFFQRIGVWEPHFQRKNVRLSQVKAGAFGIVAELRQIGGPLVKHT